MSYIFILLLTISWQLTSFAILKPISIISSNSVYSLITIAADEFGQTTSFRSPTVESSSSGRAFSLFCSKNIQPAYNILVSSRRMRESEKIRCNLNNVGDVEEIVLGYDGILVVKKIATEPLDLSYDYIFNSLSEVVMFKGQLTKNPHNKWIDINSHLPDSDIAVYIPSVGSATRQIFVDFIINKACMTNYGFRKMYPAINDLERICSRIRADGKAVEYNESINIVLRKMQSDPSTLAVVNYITYQQNKEYLQAVKIEGVEPTFENIINGSYVLIRPIYMYAKSQDSKEVAGMQQFLSEIQGENARGKSGYLVMNGLIYDEDIVQYAVKEN